MFFAMLTCIHRCTGMYCTCLCLCIYIYIYMCFDTYSHVHMYIYIHMYVCMYVCMYVYTKDDTPLPPDRSQAARTRGGQLRGQGRVVHGGRHQPSKKHSQTPGLQVQGSTYYTYVYICIYAYIHIYIYTLHLYFEWFRNAVRYMIPRVFIDTKPQDC